MGTNLYKKEGFFKQISLHRLKHARSFGYWLERWTYKIGSTTPRGLHYHSQNMMDKHIQKLSFRFLIPIIVIQKRPIIKTYIKKLWKTHTEFKGH